MTPAQVDPYVREASERFGVDRELVHAIIRVESGYHPLAVSSAGARGLMQLMPATWEAMRASLELGPDPFNARDNVLAGSYFLARLIRRYGGDIHRALAAYYWGPGNVDDHPSVAQWPPGVVRYVEAVQHVRMFGRRARPRPRPPEHGPRPPEHGPRLAPADVGGGWMILLALALFAWQWKGWR